jgi:hypothetical protein
MSEVAPAIVVLSRKDLSVAPGERREGNRWLVTYCLQRKIGKCGDLEVVFDRGQMHILKSTAFCSLE